MSLPTAVMTEGSVVRAMAARAGRSRRKRPTSSPARCWASAAEPPLPKVSTLPPARRLAAMRAPTSRSSRAFSSKKRVLSAALSFASARIPASSIGRIITRAGKGLLTRADVDREQHGQHAGIVDRHLEDRAVRDEARDVHGHGQATLDLALATATFAVEHEAARAVARGAGRGDGD